MCRITLLTAGNLDRRAAVAIVDRLMVAASQTNDDGYGAAFYSAASGNLMAYKTKADYAKSTLSWMEYYVKDAKNSVILAHNRLASKGTEVSDRTAHPFIFKSDEGSRMVAVHNGYFSGQRLGVNEDAPNSDSFVAFRKLAPQLFAIERDTLEYADIKKWAEDVCDYSAYAFVFEWKGHFYIMRNSERTLYAAQVGNGLLIHTHEQTLIGTNTFIKQMYPEYYVDARIVAIPENKFLRIAPENGNTVEIEDGFSGSVYSTAMTYADDYRVVYHTPAAEKKIVNMPAVEVNDETKRKAAVFRKILNAANPLRAQSVFIWLGIFLDREVKSYKTCTVAELETFLFAMEEDNGLTNNQKHLVNQWYKISKDRSTECETYTAVFGDKEWFLADVEESLRIVQGILNDNASINAGK